MTINKDTAFKLAKESDATTYKNQHYPDRPFFTFSPEQLERLCNLAVEHESKDLALVQNLLSEYGLQALDVVKAFKDAKNAEPVAWRRPDKHSNWEYEDGITAFAHDPTGEPVYSHPAHDDTALLRQCLDAMELKQRVTLWEQDSDKTKFNAAITALRERLEMK